MRATIDAFFFDSEQLLPIAREHRQGYAAAQPFPHVVLERLVPDEVLDAVLAEFPDPGAQGGGHNVQDTQVKRYYRDEERLGPHTRHLLGQLNSSVFIGFLEELTGIEGLLPDPSLSGGGLHQIERGGFLKVHADFNRLDRLNLDRRLNLLIYLNKDWDDAWGGYLELWDHEMAACAKKIAPTFATAVVFTTTSESFHGHPDPLQCPEDRTRNSLALYYYTSGDGGAGSSPTHTTLWQSRPRERLGARWRELVPPVVFRVRRNLRRRRANTRELMP